MTTLKGAHTLTHRIQWWAFRFYWKHLTGMGLDRASDAGGKLCRVIGPLSPAHRTARLNMRLAFPTITPPEERELLDEMWDNVGRLAGEFVQMNRLDLFGPASRATFEGLDILDRYLEPGHGAVFVSGHFANWEVMPAAIVERGVDCEVTYREANNPWVDDMIVRARADYGVKLFAPKGQRGGMRLVRILARGGSVAMMNDQKYNTGVETLFFGHGCMTNDAAVRFAHRFKVPLQTMSVARTGGARFHVGVQEPILLDFAQPVEGQVHAGLARINAFLEDTIRANPAQWFWVHARWPKDAWRKAGVED
jgi:Kdo2-lipid IVA lauroyltransferase/acyltransferase